MNVKYLEGEGNIDRKNVIKRKREREREREKERERERVCVCVGQRGVAKGFPMKDSSRTKMG